MRGLAGCTKIFDLVITNDSASIDSAALASIYLHNNSVRPQTPLRIDDNMRNQKLDNFTGPVLARLQRLPPDSGILQLNALFVAVTTIMVACSHLGFGCWLIDLIGEDPKSSTSPMAVLVLDSSRRETYY